MEAGMKKAIIITLFLVGAAFAQHEYYDEFSQPGDKIDEVIVDCPVGKITCEPATDGNIMIRVKKTVFIKDEKEAKEYADAYETSFDVNDRKLNVTLDTPRHKHDMKGLFNKLFTGNFGDEFELLIKVSLPPEIRLSISTASADIFATDLKNNIEIDGSSSDVSLENVVGNCNIDVSSGDLEVRNIIGDISLDGSSSDFDLIGVKGDIEVSVSSGDGVIEDVEGDIRVRSSSGDTRISSLRGNLDCRSTSGDLGAENVSGSVNAGSTSGTINLDHLTNNEGIYYIETTSGDVYIEIDPGFSGNLNLETTSGDIHSHLNFSFNKYTESRLTGSIGHGAGEINVETSSGDIILESF
jgi:hypothetical protein